MDGLPLCFSHEPKLPNIVQIIPRRKKLSYSLDLLKHCITLLGDFSDVRAIISTVLLNRLGWQQQKI